MWSPDDQMTCRCESWAEEGVALLEKAAGQGHAYAMLSLGDIHRQWQEHEQAVGWLTKGAEAGLPDAMFALGNCLDKGRGVAAPDYPAAAEWWRRAAVAGHGGAAYLIKAHDETRVDSASAPAFSA